MQVNVTILSKKAIEASLQKEWTKAVELNEIILNKNPNDKDAKLRLGRAYIKTEKFAKAKKLFKEILKDDPINQIALKNYELASNEICDKDRGEETSDATKVLIREPGTTTQIKIPANKKIISNFGPGEKLSMKISKNKVTFFDKEMKHEIGSLESNLAKIMHNAKDEEKELSASVIKTNGETISILIKCKCAIFKSEKQQEKPYMKGVLEESDIEAPDVEEVVEEE